MVTYQVFGLNMSNNIVNMVFLLKYSFNELFYVIAHKKSNLQKGLFDKNYLSQKLFQD
jgi:hypothetical protein